MSKLLQITTSLSLYLFSHQIWASEICTQTGLVKKEKICVELPGGEKKWTKNSGKKIGDPCEIKNSDGGWAEVDPKNPGSIRLICLEEASSKKWKRNYGWDKSVGDDCYSSDPVGLSKLEDNVKYSSKGTLTLLKCDGLSSIPTTGTQKLQKGKWSIDRTPSNNTSVVTANAAAAAVVPQAIDNSQHEPTKNDFPKARASASGDLTFAEMDAIKSAIEKDLATASMSLDQSLKLIETAINIAQKAKRNGADGALEHFIPNLKAAYDQDSDVKTIVNSIDHRPFSDLEGRYQAILQPKSESIQLFETNKWGKIIAQGQEHHNLSKKIKKHLSDTKSHGKILLYPSFNIVDAPIQEILKNLVFECKDGLCPQEKMPPLSHHASFSGSCGLKFSQNCNVWKTFKKHLRGCHFDTNMEACITAASEKDLSKKDQKKNKESTIEKIKEMLREFYHEEFEDSAPAKEDANKNDLTVGLTVQFKNHGPSILTREKFPTADSFADDPMVIKNAFEILKLNELKARETTNKLSKEIKDLQKLKSLLTAFLKDGARYIAKIDVAAHNNQGALGKAGQALKTSLTGADHVESTANKLLKVLMKEEVKEEKAEEKHDQKGHAITKN